MHFSKQVKDSVFYIHEIMNSQNALNHKIFIIQSWIKLQRGIFTIIKMKEKFMKPLTAATLF